MRKIIWIEIAAAAIWALFVGTALAQAQQAAPVQAPMVEQWHQKAQADMQAMTSALNLGLTAINSDMEHLRAEILGVEQQLRDAQGKLKDAEDKLKAADERAKAADGKAAEPGKAPDPPFSEGGAPPHP